MNISLDEQLAPVVDSLIKSGRYASAEEVVRQGVLLVQAEEEKLQSLRDMINASIAAGGSFTDEEVSAYLDAVDFDASDEEWAEKDL